MTLDRFLDPRRGWRVSGSGTGSWELGKGKRVGFAFTTCAEGDEVEVRKETPSPRGVSLFVEVRESSVPQDAWTNLRR